MARLVEDDIYLFKTQYYSLKQQNINQVKNIVIVKIFNIADEGQIQVSEKLYIIPINFKISINLSKGKLYNENI